MLKQILALQLIAPMILLISMPSFASERFTDMKNGVVKDNHARLLWVKNPDLLPSTRGAQTWEVAYNACKELVHGGIGPNTWQLPRIQQLKELVDTNFANPTINGNYFSANGAPYWSQTPYRPGAKAWTVNFKNGSLGYYEKFNTNNPIRHYTRCVTGS